MLRRRLALFVSFVTFVSSVLFASVMSAQTVTQRGFVDGGLMLFPQQTPHDPVRLVGDVLAREEVFLKPTPWMQFAAGVDLRANSHEQVDNRWRLDVSDRGAQRPLLSLRRLSATLTHGPFTVDVGKQFIRWGKADIVNPTDRFAPRDFINVVDTEFLAVTGVRAVAQTGDNTFEVVWVPRFTPSRVPLLDQRWTAVPAEAAAIPLVDGGSTLPEGSETGARWGHIGAGFEYSLSFFNGFNHLPNIDSAVKMCSACSASSALIVISRLYPQIRTYGADAALPTKWFTLKGEAAYVTSASPSTDEYVLYVIQVERQTGEFVIVAGYAGETVTSRRSTLAFAPDRGMTRSVVTRVSYTIDPNRSVAFESAVRQSGDGLFAKVEYSQSHGQHWRTTVSAVAIAGHSDDFLGQYHRNSHVGLGLRYSF